MLFIVYDRCVLFLLTALPTCSRVTDLLGDLRLYQFEKSRAVKAFNFMLIIVRELIAVCLEFKLFHQ